MGSLDALRCPIASFTPRHDQVQALLEAEQEVSLMKLYTIE